MLTNTEIVKRSLPLVKKCVSYQLVHRPYWHLQEDIEQDLILALLEYDNDKMNAMYEENHLNAFITRILQNQLISSSSYFFRTYVRPQALANEIGENELNIEDNTDIYDRKKQTNV